MSIFASTAFYNIQPAGAGPVAAIYGIRPDTYASQVQLAVPGTAFTGAPLSMAYYYSDISADVRGSGTNLVAAPTGSGTEFKSDTPTNFSSDGYTTSLFAQDAGCWGQVSATAFAIGTQSYVVESYFYFTENWNMPPFWNSLIRQREGVNDDWYADIGGPSSPGNSVRMRFLINGNQYFTSFVTVSLNSWTHVAWVRSSGNLYGYVGGTRLTAGSDGASISSSGLVRVIGGNSAANDGQAASHQDIRITIGTDRGYNTATITPPPSIVYQTN
jgi:hypothetical protein